MVTAWITAAIVGSLVTVGIAAALHASSQRRMRFRESQLMRAREHSDEMLRLARSQIAMLKDELAMTRRMHANDHREAQAGLVGLSHSRPESIVVNDSAFADTELPPRQAEGGAAAAFPDTRIEARR